MHRTASSVRSQDATTDPTVSKSSLPSCGPTQNRPSLLFVPTWWTDLIASAQNDTEGTSAKGIRGNLRSASKRSVLPWLLRSYLARWR
jgi:hypothetical protein